MSKLQIGFCSAAMGMSLLAGCLVSDPARSTTDQPISRGVEAGRAAPQAPKRTAGGGAAATSGAGASGRSQSAGGAGAASEQAGAAAEDGTAGAGGRAEAKDEAGAGGKAGAPVATNLAGHAAVGGEGGEHAEAGGTSGTPGARPGTSQPCPGISKLDLLFVVDNSNSMAREQESLKRQFPAIIQALTSGKRPTAGSKGFPSVKDIHVGVVSTDMGIPGVEFPGGNCHADGGDDGKLRHEPHGDGCDSSYPPFLGYVNDLQTGPTPEPVKFANDVGCIATLGTAGCGFEEQLEAPFKALWPKVQNDAAGLVVPNNEYHFLATTEQGTWGKGDVPAAQGGNEGFLRNRRDQGGPSLIAIVLVTDEEDCSVKVTEHLKPNNQLAEDSPYRMEDINLRCYNHKEFLYDIKKRYFEGLRKLRPGLEDRVVFAAIAGVPTDLVSPDALAKVDFSADDASSRDAFYDAILNDSRMQETLDPTTNPGSGQGNLKPSCSRIVPGETQPSTAWPPRRIVELAKLFGRNGMVQSICQDDFTQVSSAVVETIARRLEQPCP